MRNTVRRFVGFGLLAVIGLAISVGRARRKTLDRQDAQSNFLKFLLRQAIRQDCMTNRPADQESGAGDEFKVIGDGTSQHSDFHTYPLSLNAVQKRISDWVRSMALASPGSDSGNT